MIDYTEIDKRLASEGLYRAQPDAAGWYLSERTPDGERMVLRVTDDKADAIEGSDQ